MIGIYHFLVGISFFFGTVLLDLDHRPWIWKEMIGCIFKKSYGENLMQRGVLHSWYVFYLLLSLTLGVFIHLKMDGVL